MSKKNFTSGLDSLLGGSKEAKPTPRANTPKEGLKGTDTRATFVLEEQVLEKIKAVAYWERRLIKEVVTEALLNYLSEYEKKKGEVKPRPSTKPE